MENNTFLNKLGFDGSKEPDIDHVERKFLESIKDRIQSIQACFDKSEVEDTEKWLSDIHNEFFHYAAQWANRELKKTRNVKGHPDSAKLKKQAREILDDLQNNIVKFAICYMHINRYMTIVRDEIKQEETRMISGINTKGIKWTSDAGEVIKRYKKRKREIKDEEARFLAAADMLEVISQGLDNMRSSAHAVFGKEKADPLIRRFVSSLRVSDFVKARKALKEISETKKKFSTDAKLAEKELVKISDLGGKLVSLVSDNQKLLMGSDNKLFLRPDELAMIQKSNQNEINNMNLFLAKYHLPYMQYKLNTLSHLREKLLVLGSLESLLTLYKSLISGIAQPMPDIRAMREYENQILEKAKYLLSGQFQELPNIVSRANETVKEFQKSKEEFKEIEKNLKDIDQSAIDVQEAASN
jgi:hypothetical protein